MSWISRRNFRIYLVVAAFVFCYTPVFLSLATHWLSNDVYYHAFLIPVVSMYLVWLKKPLLSKCAPTPNYILGSTLLILGLALLSSGQIAGVKIIQQLSLVATLPALVVLLFGIGHLRIIAFPLAYLFLMLPIGVDLLTNYYYPFQLWTADLATLLLRAFSVPAFHDGIHIQLPEIRLEVAKECSGIRYLIAVISLCLPLGYLFVNGLGRQLALLSFAIIVAMLGNGLRVALIGIFSFYHLADTTHGPAHIFQGLFVSIIGYIGIGIGLLIFRCEPFGSRQLVDSGAVGVSAKAQFNMVAPTLSLVLSLCTVFLASGVLGSVHQRAGSFPSLSLEHFPEVMGAWQYVELAPSSELMEALGENRKLSRRYRGPTNETITLYIGVYDGHVQSGSLDFSRLPGQFDTVSKGKLVLAANQDITINRGYRADSSGVYISYSWLSVDGSVWLSPIYAKAHMFWNAIRNERTDIVQVVITIQGEGMNESDANKERALREFSREVYSLIDDWFASHTTYMRY